MRTETRRLRDDGVSALFLKGDAEGARVLIANWLCAYTEEARQGSVIADEFALEYVQLLVYGGLLSEAQDFMNSLQRIPPKLAEYFYIVKTSVLLCAKFMREDPPRSTRSRILCALPLWGEPFLEIWENAALPAFLDQSASPLFADRDVEFHVYTCSVDRERLMAMPDMHRLARRASIRFFNLDTVLIRDGKRSYSAMNLAHWATMTMARMTGSGMLPLFGDALYGNGSLGELDAAIRSEKHDVVYTIYTNIDQEFWQITQKKNVSSSRMDCLSCDELSSAYLKYPSKRDYSWVVDTINKVVPVNATQLKVVEPGCSERRTTWLQPVFLSAKALQSIWWRDPICLDLCVPQCAWAAYGSGDRNLVITDANRFLLATIDFRHGLTRDDDSTMPADDVIKQLLDNLAARDLATSANRWALSHALVVGERSGPSPLKSLVDEFPTHRTKGALGSERYARFIHDVLLPAFNQYRGQIQSVA
jgi:hypothetical protein